MKRSRYWELDPDRPMTPPGRAIQNYIMQYQVERLHETFSRVVIDMQARLLPIFQKVADAAHESVVAIGKSIGADQ